MAKLQSKNLSGVKLTGLQKQVLSYIVSRAEEEHSYLIDVDRSDIVSELKIKGTGTIAKIFCRLEDYGLFKSLGGNSYKLSSTFFEFVETKTDTAFTNNKVDLSAEEFLPVAEWLQDVATAEDNQSYCIAYRTLKDSKNSFTEEEKLVARGYLIDKVNQYGMAPVVEKINKTCNATDIVELIRLIA